MDVRCRRCYMPTGVGADGVAEVHDFPYAVAHYGQCPGSGLPTLPGAGYPPLVWGAQVGQSWVEVGALPSPMPEVTREGSTVTLTGVRFVQSADCERCRCVVYTVRSGGWLRIGFDRQGEVFERSQPGPLADFRVLCPGGCGGELSRSTWERCARTPVPVVDAESVKCREWERLQAVAFGPGAAPARRALAGAG
ncbi:hypothetical protein [Kitasatospora sp. NPDC086791]|uniref:hypothetical protein n=1 Tax=Kitasatospora sp. NPDC086791 TaxID=3155178 RepID=UPI003446C7F0